MLGKTLGQYEIIAPLGAGGMGEVYRARDATLKREVAIKVLPQDLSTDADRLARLEREAHLLASLSHPNIATIFSLEEIDGTRFLVLELIEGESLQQRLARGPLPIEEALHICGQIARALEVAHDAGIVHRDLKPANVLITPDDHAKVLDFGIAKTLPSAGQGDDTVKATELTMAGTMVGTAPYMGPEQVRGEPVDGRSDIWAFGCVFFETLSGKGPFTRETMADTLAAIVGEEPDWDTLPVEVPNAVRSLLHRCLQKNPKVRQRHIGDAWVEINQSLSHSGGVPMSMPPTIAAAAAPGLGRRVAAGLVIAALAIGGIAGWWLGPEAPVPGEPMYFDVDLPRGSSFPPGGGPTIAISPDGKTIAFVGQRGFTQKLFVRHLDEAGDPVPVEGTDGAQYPFFSPDGVSLAFDAPDDSIKVISLEGDDSQVLCRACSRGAWGDDGSLIVRTDEFGNMWARIPEPGTAAMEELPSPSFMGEQLQPNRVDVLPGSRAVLFEDEGAGGIYALSLETEEVVQVAKPGTDPFYAGGYVLYRRDNTLYAVSFDVGALSVTSDPIVAQRDVRTEDGGALHAAVSRADGVLVFAPTRTTTPGFRLGWVDRTGVWADIAGDPQRIGVSPRVSPDGRLIALLMGPDPGGVWLVDDRTKAFAAFHGTDHEGITDVRHALWSRDGSSITYRELRRNETEGEPFRESAIVRRLVGGSRAAETLRAAPFATTPSWSPASWTPDDDRLIYGVSGAPRLLVAARDAEERDSVLFEDVDAGSYTLSHDGKWLSYVSRRFGSEKVYVRPFPAGDEVPVSPASGGEPRWGPDDKELFYVAEDHLVSAHVRVIDGEFNVESHEVLFDVTAYRAMSGSGLAYDVHPDGNRFVMIRPNSVDDPAKINVVINWFEDIARRAAEPSQQPR